MSVRQNNAVVVDLCTRRLNALGAFVDGSARIAINGKRYTLADVVAIYQGCLDSRTALAAQRANTKAALATRADAEAARREADRGLKAWVENEFGIGSKEAIAFGFLPARKPTRKIEDRAQAVALGKATREARHTMGKKQKLLIKGTLPVPTAPAEPATHSPAEASPASQPATAVVANGGSA